MDISIEKFLLDAANESQGQVSMTVSFQVSGTKQRTNKEIANMWTCSTNARNYAVFGDPAVRIAVSPPSDHDTSSTNSWNFKVWFKGSNKPPEDNVQQF